MCIHNIIDEQLKAQGVEERECKHKITHDVLSKRKTEKLNKKNLSIARQAEIIH